jgi:iron complex transport system permease protein
MTAGSRSALIVALAAIATLAIGFAGLLVGARPMAPEAALRALVSPGQGLDGVVLWSLRMPRSIAAFLAGAGLAVSGHLLQAITRNPLAAPDLTGVSAGAVAAIVGTFVFLPAVSAATYPFIGFAGGLLAAMATLWLVRGGQASPLHLALGGVTVSLFLSGITAYVLLRGGARSPSVMFWLSGGFQGRSWAQVSFMLPWLAIGLGGALLCHRVVEILSFDDDMASGWGVDPGLWKLVLLILAICLAAAVAPVAGPIAFVGLAVPHVVRLLRPAGSLWALLCNIVIGGMLLVASDILARTIAAPRELPVGIVTAVIGGPVFIWLVQGRGGSTSRRGGP